MSSLCLLLEVTSEAILGTANVFQKLPWGAFIGAGALNRANMVCISQMNTLLAETVWIGFQQQFKEDPRNK